VFFIGFSKRERLLIVRGINRFILRNRGLR
jgi:hypothetical protein